MSNNTPFASLPALSGVIVSTLDPWDAQEPWGGGYVYEDYPLTGVLPGTSIWIAMEADFDAWLEIINSVTQEVVAWDDDSGQGTNALLGFLPQEGLTYGVRASSFFAGSTGSYTLRILSVADAERERTAGAPAWESTPMPRAGDWGISFPSKGTWIWSGVITTIVNQPLPLTESVELWSDVYPLENLGNTILWHDATGQVFVEVGGQRLPVSSPWSVGVGDASTVWRMLAAETLDGVNTLLWRHNPTNALHLWTLDAHWSWQSSGGLILLGTAEAWDLENRFLLDLDDDGFLGTPPTVVTLSVSAAAVAEDSSQALVYTFSRTGATAAPLRVNTLVGGSATPWSDYTGLTATGQSVTFAAGSATATLTLSPVADTRIEGNETIALSLVPGDGYVVGTPMAVRSTLLNDDSRITLYNPAGSLPSQQGWLAFGTGFVGRQSLSGRGTLLDSTTLLADIAGYSNHGSAGPTLVNTAFPALDRGVGFGLDLTLRLDNETHLSDNRAGVSLLLLDQGATPVGIELGFWTNRIFSQGGGATPFTAVGEAVEGIDTRSATSYSLRMFDDTYFLLANKPDPSGARAGLQPDLPPLPSPLQPLHNSQLCLPRRQHHPSERTGGGGGGHPQRAAQRQSGQRGDDRHGRAGSTQWDGRRG